MATDINDSRVVAVFKTHSRRNEAKSKAEGRPIYDDMEVVEVRFAGNRQTVGVYPAHAFYRTVPTEDGGSEEQTYAMRWNDQYKRFKERRQQVQEGTPLEELPFLTQGKRMELKALHIHTAEALAAVDGNELKNLGMGGRELKDQAQAYIDNARGSADVTRLAAENAKMKEELARLRRDASQPRGKASKAKDDNEDGDAGSEFETWEDDDLKAFIKEKTGQTPRGNPGHETLVRMAEEAKAEGAG